MSYSNINILKYSNNLSIDFLFNLLITPFEDFEIESLKIL